MATIGPSSMLIAQINQYLRVATGGSAAAAARQRARRGNSGSSLDGHIEASGGGAESLSAMVARRIASIDLADPSRERLAFRVFLESVVMADLGEHLSGHPSIDAVLSRVEQEMASDAATLSLMVQAGAELLSRRSDAAL